VGNDGMGRFEVDGESFEANSEAGLHGFLEEHGWHPLRVILGLDSPGVETTGKDLRWRSRTGYGGSNGR
jgi:hypothetical protein